MEGKKGVILRVEYADSVVEVKRGSDSSMSLKLEVEGVILNVVRLDVSKKRKRSSGVS